MQNVTIFAPAAIASFGVVGPTRQAQNLDVPLTAEDLVALLTSENRRLLEEVEKHKIASSTISKACAGLVVLLCERDDLEILIPRHVYDGLVSRTITLAETGDRDILVRVRENIENPGWEGV